MTLHALRDRALYVTPVRVVLGVAWLGRQAVRATLPSTVGVSALAAVALAFEPTLTALLGGISTGPGVAGALYALRADPTLFVEPRTGALYRRT